MTSLPKKFSLSLDIEKIEVTSRWKDFVGIFDIIPGEINSMSLEVTNDSEDLFPGCSLKLSMQEHGPSPSGNPLRWTKRDLIEIPEIQPNATEAVEFILAPLIVGLYIALFTVSGITGDVMPVENVEISGFRSALGREVSFYFNSVSTEMLYIHETLAKVAEHLIGESNEPI